LKGSFSASSIVFQAGIKFNRPLIDQRLALIAEALKLPFKDDADGATLAINRAAELIREASLPTRLRDIGVARDELDGVAEAVMHDRQLRNNPKPVRDKAEIVGVLEEMW